MPRDRNELKQNYPMNTRYLFQIQGTVIHLPHGSDVKQYLKEISGFAKVTRQYIENYKSHNKE